MSTRWSVSPASCTESCSMPLSQQNNLYFKIHPYVQWTNHLGCSYMRQAQVSSQATHNLLA